MIEVKFRSNSDEVVFPDSAFESDAFESDAFETEESD